MVEDGATLCAKCVNCVDGGRCRGSGLEEHTNLKSCKAGGHCEILNYESSAARKYQITPMTSHKVSSIALTKTSGYTAYHTSFKKQSSISHVADRPIASSTPPRYESQHAWHGRRRATVATLRGYMTVPLTSRKFYQSSRLTVLEKWLLLRGHRKPCAPTPRPPNQL